nr:MAG TPA: hypothetical protein [Caudoviricetes sp.]
MIMNNVLYYNYNKNKISDFNYYYNKGSKDLTSFIMPFLFIRYFKPKVQNNMDIIIPYYVSDYYQSELLHNNKNMKFTTVVNIGDKEFKKTTYSGEQFINIGKIETIGETYFSIYTIDENGISSFVQFFDILITNENSLKDDEIYIMVEDDLNTYNITLGDINDVNLAKQNNIGINQLLSNTKNNGYKKIIMINDIYTLDYHENEINPPSNFIVDLNNATFKVTQCNDISSGKMFNIKTVINTHVINGNLIGNYKGFDFVTTQTNTGSSIPGEGLSVIDIYGSKYCSFENIKTSNSVGYNIGVFQDNNNIMIGGLASVKFINRYYINTVGEEIDSDILSTTDYIDISRLLEKGEFQVNVYQGYAGYKGTVAEIFIHFYDGNKNYIRTIKSRQYQICKILDDNVKYIRITGFTNGDDMDGMNVQYINASKNCELINIYSKHTRSCAMHPGVYNHLLIKDCKFDDVASESGEFQVTKLALDFEDGYQYGRNLFFINNEVLKGVNSLAIVHCFNCNISKNKGFSLDLRGGIKGGNIRSNYFVSSSFPFSTFIKQSHGIYDNNSIMFNATFKFDDNLPDTKICLSNCNFHSGVTDNGHLIIS